jgi:hypothetical protein
MQAIDSHAEELGGFKVHDSDPMPLLKPCNEHLAGAYEVVDSKTYLDPIEDTDGIPFKEVEAPWQAAIGSDQEAKPTIPLKLYGSEGEIQELNALCHEYSDIISIQVCKEPADVEPLDIVFDHEKWNSLRVNQASARPVSALKQAEIQRQMDVMVDLGVIQASHADIYLQVLMVPKPRRAD